MSARFFALSSNLVVNLDEIVSYMLVNEKRGFANKITQHEGLRVRMSDATVFFVFHNLELGSDAYRIKGLLDKAVASVVRIGPEEGHEL